MAEKIMCKKNYCDFKKGKIYDYWYNFGGLNHFVGKTNGMCADYMIFCGPIYDKSVSHDIFYRSERPWIYDFFYTKEEVRNIKIDIIIS